MQLRLTYGVVMAGAWTPPASPSSLLVPLRLQPSPQSQIPAPAGPRWPHRTLGTGGFQPCRRPPWPHRPGAHGAASGAGRPRAHSTGPTGGTAPHGSRPGCRGSPGGCRAGSRRPGLRRCGPRWLGCRRKQRACWLGKSCLSGGHFRGPLEPQEWGITSSGESDRALLRLRCPSGPFPASGLRESRPGEACVLGLPPGPMLSLGRGPGLQILPFLPATALVQLSLAKPLHSQTPGTRGRAWHVGRPRAVIKQQDPVA